MSEPRKLSGARNRKSEVRILPDAPGGGEAESLAAAKHPPTGSPTHNPTTDRTRLHRCAWEHCPGYTWRASESPHPCGGPNSRRREELSEAEHEAAILEACEVMSAASPALPEELALRRTSDDVERDLRAGKLSTAEALDELARMRAEQADAGDGEPDATILGLEGEGPLDRHLEGVPPLAVLVACGAGKLEHAAPARELYCGSLFVLRLRWAEAHGGLAGILSAKHGLLDPDQVIEPYDVTLGGLPKPERVAWAARVRDQLLQRFAKGTRLVVLAGRPYVQGWAADVERAGLVVDHRGFPGVGYERASLSREIAEVRRG